ncbi:SH3 domain and tetratricopeptide repeat-containing protein 2 isoform X3 [Silurus meridionalis]|uniref:SH3 domain and tetratricopeptide repeat-containing protein 2 isoform X3 n=1 Tax=Silurus meridionalis TaxID=175797 RepID=UPI001EEC47C4|nr:SH3 domain and tetratricopeptide repeat-containing protein 2 isoform X3 [Silurus meridionalis]KAI5105085.1 SH3 domain and tetratricopeptide repeat-containing protein 2 isoform X2 [Silurus meridionalis]
MKDEHAGRNQKDRDISTPELNTLWEEPPYVLTRTNELFPGNDVMASGDEEVETEAEVEGESITGESYWKRKEALSTVSLAVGDHFSSDVILLFSGRRRSNLEPDSVLQEALRTRLRVVESNSQDVIQLFKDLSARLVSVHAEKDYFVITFKTVEEIWKFSTYLALGYVARCLENFLCDQSLWLDPLLLSDVEICVTVDEEHLATLYLGLLLQEGSFFAKALVNSEQYIEDEDKLIYKKNDLVIVKDIGQQSMWEGTLLSTGQHGLVPVKAMQPLPYPFYQWFLRKYHGNAGGFSSTKAQCDQPIVTGTYVAVVDHYSMAEDELHFSQGDLIEVEGLLIRSLNTFIGRHTSGGQIGFVDIAHVRPENVKSLSGQLVFLTEEETVALSQFNPCVEQCHTGLLDKLFFTDISTVYRLDRLDDSDFTYIKNQPKQEQKNAEDARKSIIMEHSHTPSYHSSPQPSFYASQSCLDRENEPFSFSLEDTFKEMDKYQEDPPFMDEGMWDNEEAEIVDPILTLLNLDHFQDSFHALYDLSYSFLETVFGGLPVDEVLLHLESLREGAKKGRMVWAHRRACFLLGRLCAKKLKFSQARVYFEEALNVPVAGFNDIPLLIALYTNLTAVYLKQKMTDKLIHTLEKASALILCLPMHNFCSLDEFELLKPILRKAIVDNDMHLEARACYLILCLFLQNKRIEEALPFVERLQFLTLTLSAEEGRPIRPVDLNWILCRLYHKKYLPYLALASLSLDSGQGHSLDTAFQKIELFLKNSVRLNPCWKDGSALLPAQMVVYLQQALSIANCEEHLKTQRDLCLCLASVYQQYGSLEKAVLCAQQAVQAGRCINEEECFEASVLLAWLLVITEEPDRAQSTLQPLLNSLNSTARSAQHGVVHNLLALCLRKQGKITEAAKYFHCALKISQDNGNKHNEALALANLGCLALSVGAPGLAESFLLRSLYLFQFLSESPSDEEHVQTLLWLGRSYKDRGECQKVRLSYEMGLLIAISAKNLHSQMVVSKVLSRLYADLMLYGQCIIYYEHCVGLARELKDKRLEGEYLEILSNLYLSLNTEKSSLKSLDYTKQSLRISIDLGKKQEESETWLQVGRIYYLIGEDELADMYLQAAVKTALRINDPCFAMNIYEEAGDVFFKGHRNRLAAISFFRDGGLPFARYLNNVHSEFRLLCKLSELLLKEGQHQEALQYATLSVQISTSTGVRLNEKVSYHRLASIYFTLKQYELAENYYLKALSLSPTALEHAEEARYYVKVYCRLADLTLHKIKDAYDAMGYFHLALAAALEDGGSIHSRYIIYMKLAEIHANYLPDVKLSQTYMDSARNLKMELAGPTDSVDAKDDYMNHGAAEYANAEPISCSNEEPKNFRSRSNTLVGSYVRDKSHSITSIKEAEAVPADCMCGEDMDICNPDGTNSGLGQPTNSEIRHTNQRLHTSHTDSGLLCTEF